MTHYFNKCHQELVWMIGYALKLFIISENLVHMLESIILTFRVLCGILERFQVVLLCENSPQLLQPVFFPWQVTTR